jgi:hypothetical protein
MKTAQPQSFTFHIDGQTMTATLSGVVIGSVEISLFDMQGKQVWKKSYDDVHSGISTFSGRLNTIGNGSYLVQVKKNGVVAQSRTIALTE